MPNKYGTLKNKARLSSRFHFFPSLPLFTFLIMPASPAHTINEECWFCVLLGNDFVFLWHGLFVRIIHSHCLRKSSFPTHLLFTIQGNSNRPIFIPAIGSDIQLFCLIIINNPYRIAHAKLAIFENFFFFYAAASAYTAGLP